MATLFKKCLLSGALVFHKHSLLVFCTNDVMILNFCSRADFFEVFAPKCGGCGRAIVDNYITALNRHWHPECFACWVCIVEFVFALIL